MHVVFIVSGKHEAGQPGFLSVNFRSEDREVPSNASMLVPREAAVGLEPGDRVTLTIAAAPLLSPND